MPYYHGNVAAPYMYHHHQRAQQVVNSMVKSEEPVYTPNGWGGHYLGADHHPGHYDYYPTATTPQMQTQHVIPDQHSPSSGSSVSPPSGSPPPNCQNSRYDIIFCYRE